MKVLQTSTFQRAVKKLYGTQKKSLDDTIKTLIQNPLLGQQKCGDLQHIRVFKFSLSRQQMLLAYTYQDDTLTLMALGSHENFYRDLKRS